MSASSFAPLSFSIEIFPPRSPDAERRLAETLKRLDPHAPEFISVTFTGGDGALDRSATTIARTRRQTKTPIAAHLTCAGASKEDSLNAAQTFNSLGVKHVVALRGDAENNASGGYETAAELVAALRSNGDFRISVAAYPDPHPLSQSQTADLDNLVAKFDAGADDAITQFFFEPESFLRLRDQLAARGVDKPLIPGVLPIVDFAQTRRFALRCGAHVPEQLTQSFKRLRQYPSQAELFSIAYTLDLIDQLAQEGIDRFHIYSLNQSRLPEQLMTLSRAGAALAVADQAVRNARR
ncbi:MAG: methylenetetrahydrofolate reductase [Pseudomonadota bacterium]